MVDLEKLEAIISDIWKHDIRKDVNEGRVKCERDLHCCLYYWLRQKTDNMKDISIFSEYQYSLPEPKNAQPDILIYDKLSPDFKSDPPLIVFELKIGKCSLGIYSSVSDFFSRVKKDWKKLNSLHQKHYFKKAYVCWVVVGAKGDVELSGKETHDLLYESYSFFREEKTVVKDPTAKGLAIEAQGIKGGDEEDWRVISL